MKTIRTAGFSLLEMIGVLAVIAIIATVLTPNLVHSLDLATARAEATSLANLGTQLENYVRDNGSLPVHGAANADPRAWAVTLASYADLNAADLTRNKRDVIRGYLTESTGNRAMLVSGLRAGLTVPSGATVNDAQFQQIWDTAANTVPPVSSWAGWAAWATYPDLIVIGRVNVSALRKSYTAILNNADVLAVTVSYRVRALDGTLGAATAIAPAAQKIVTPLRHGERVELYGNSTGTGTAIFTQVMTDEDVSLTYNSGFWR